MNNITDYYTSYRQHIEEYKCWDRNNNNTSKEQTAPDAVISCNNELKQKAKTIAEPLLLCDSYEHERAEDAETFFQTLNIELLSITGAICSFPAAVTKIIPFLNKHQDKNKIIKKSFELLEKYKNSSIKITGKNIAGTKIATGAACIFGALFYANGIKNSMESQLGLIRKASFDATQNIINAPELFAVLTPEQENKVNSIVSYDENHKSDFVDKIKDRVNINSSFQAVGEYNKNYADYEKKKKDYNDKLNKTPDKTFSNEQINQAENDKLLFENYLKNVEHDVLEPLRKVETISNISYSSMFTGGFLEYLISDKLVEILKIKNKVLGTGIKIGMPLLTYLLLNKNISDIENKAILATKYKHLKQFAENPMQYSHSSEDKKESLPQFIKGVYKDMKEYEKFSQNELPKLKEKMEAKRQIKLTPEQEKDAKRLQKNTSMVINTQREELYNQSVGIKALSETILGPIDVLAAAIGGYIGHNMAKKFPDKKLSGLFTGLGAVIAFIPAAITEAKLTKQQKLSEKIAVMEAIKKLQDPKKFVDFNSDSEITYFPLLSEKDISPAFKEFLKP